jgi:predicted dehydrogenase
MLSQNVSLSWMRVGVVGCGKISEVYLHNLTRSPEVEVVACSDVFLERAEQRAAEFGVPKACGNDELLADPNVEMVVNLTVPLAHAEVTLAAIAAGKHVVSEKPLATTMDDARRIRRETAARRVTVACAPDTFLGPGLQTSLALLRGGRLGEPLAATAFMVRRGPESWHANPVIFYSAGAGPLLDVGVYYVTQLVSLLGPVRRVAGMGRILYPELRPVQGPRAGDVIPVTTPTFVAGLLEFASGVQAVLVTSFGIPGDELPHLRLYCTGGILGVPDPNTFAGPVLVRSNEQESPWREEPLLFETTKVRADSRGIGVIEAVRAIRSGREPRASLALAYHVLEVMLGVLESGETGRHLMIESTCEPPEPLPADEGLVATP